MLRVSQDTISSLFCDRAGRIDAIGKHATEVAFKAGETVFSRGEKADYLYSVLSGRVSLRMPQSTGVSLPIEELAEGALFGSCICFEFKDYSLTASCTADSKLFKIPAADLKLVMEEDLTVGYPLQRLVSQTYFKRYLDTMEKLRKVAEALALTGE